MNDGTFRLAEEFVSNQKECERLLNARWWRNPARWCRRKFGGGYSHNLTAAETLATRYEGVIWQLFRRAGISETKMQDYMIAVWQEVTAEARTLSDSRRLSKLLWDAVLSRCPSSSLLSLKPKFMLRQFVDEMESSDERGALCSIAYGEQTPRAFTRELLKLLTRSYSYLHPILLRHRSELDTLSDGAITEKMIESICSPYLEYEEWLFANRALTAKSGNGNDTKL